MSARLIWKGLRVHLLALAIMWGMGGLAVGVLYVVAGILYTGGAH